MAATRDDIDHFHQFAIDRLDSDDAPWELDELVLLWYDSHDRQQVNAVIRQGLADIDAGLGRPARQVMGELRERLCIANRMN
jgi:hypothetical protein